MKKRRILITLLLIILLLPIGFYLVNPYKINKPNIIEIYDINDNLIYSYNNNYEGEYIPLDKINPHLINSILISEDRNFYNHKGLNFKRIIKALIVNLKHQKIKQGGSSISQQVARMLFLDNKKSLTRKIKEAFIALKLETHYSKNKILEIYLNSLYFGSNLFGVAAASKFYFNLPQEELSLAKCCYLCALINKPNEYLKDPTNKDALKRKNLILNLLYEHNIIDYVEFTLAYNEKLNILKSLPLKTNDNFFFDYVKSFLKKYQKLNYRLNGLKVYTTFDPFVSDIVNKTIKKYEAKLTNLETSIIILKPFSYKLVYLTGSKDYNLSKYNRALYSKRQIGSLVKPLIYYLALINNHNVVSKYTSEKITFTLENNQTYSPKNSTDKYPNKPITMLEAIASSDNIYAVKVGLKLGIKTISRALSFFMDEKVKEYPSLLLGSNETSLFKLARLYNTFASLGNYSTPFLIRKITLEDGNDIYKHSLKTKKVLNKDICLILTSALKSPFDSNIKSINSPTLLNYKPKETFYAKSGSTSKDLYVIGYNKDYLIAIWSGYDNSDLNLKSNISKLLFLDIANGITRSKKTNKYQLTNNVYFRKIDPLSGNDDENGSYYLFRK